MSEQPDAANARLAHEIDDVVADLLELQEEVTSRLILLRMRLTGLSERVGEPDSPFAWTWRLRERWLASVDDSGRAVAEVGTLSV